MSRHHRAVKWTTTSAQQRTLMRPAVDAGNAICWRCRHPIVPGTRWDVGHVEDANGRWVGTYAPEHALKRDCPAGGNRSAGGRKGAAVQNQHRQRTRTTNLRLPNW